MNIKALIESQALFNEKNAEIDRLTDALAASEEYGISTKAQLRDAHAEIERLTRERDEAMLAARQLYSGHGTDWQRMEWLKEREGEG